VVSCWRNTGDMGDEGQYRGSSCGTKLLKDPSGAVDMGGILCTSGFWITPLDIVGVKERDENPEFNCCIPLSGHRLSSGRSWAEGRRSNALKAIQ